MSEETQNTEIIDTDTDTDIDNISDTDTDTDNYEEFEDTSKYDNLSDEEFLELINSKDFVKDEKEEAEEVEKESETDNFNDISDTDTNDTENKANTDIDTKENELKEELYKRLFVDGCKANNVIVKPETVDDVISSFQKGLNYDKKMNEINKSKRQLESLKNAGIETLEDLNYVIDLYKGNTEAIKKLINDKQIDINSLDSLYDEENQQYKANTENIISEHSINFKEIVASIENKPYYEKVKETVLKDWDESSRSRLLNDTTLFKQFVEEFEIERFDTVSQRIEQLRAFGRLDGLSDLDAYIKVVQDMVNANTNTKKETTESNKIKDIDVNKNAVTPTKNVSKPSSSKKVYTDKELDELSDEDFMKLVKSGAFKK